MDFVLRASFWEQEPGQRQWRRWFVKGSMSLERCAHVACSWDKLGLATKARPRNWVFVRTRIAQAISTT